MNQLVDQVWRIARRRGVQFMVKYIKSEFNPADKPSRFVPNAKRGFPAAKLRECYKRIKRISREELLEFTTTKFFHYDQE